jgi:hypothetical protein
MCVAHYLRHFPKTKRKNKPGYSGFAEGMMTKCKGYKNMATMGTTMMIVCCMNFSFAFIGGGMYFLGEEYMFGSLPVDGWIICW